MQEERTHTCTLYYVATCCIRKTQAHGIIVTTGFIRRIHAYSITVATGCARRINAHRTHVDIVQGGVAMGWGS